MLANRLCGVVWRGMAWRGVACRVALEGFKWRENLVYNFVIRRPTAQERARTRRIEFLRKMSLLQDHWLYQNPKVGIVWSFADFSSFIFS